VTHDQHDEKDFVATPSQTVGPFFHLGLTNGQDCGRMADPAAQGEHIRVAIRIFDAEGAGVPDAMVELWQADANGKYNHPDDPQHKNPDPAFRGYGRLPSDKDGRMIFETVRPGRVSGIDGALQAPHINVHIFSRGILRHVSTRIYFAGDSANADDAILRLVPAARRDTLMAHPDARQPETWNIDFHLCGDAETVFFDA
jgi:protocatechuate 3,4-dioxygenase alpha subunit